MKKRHLAAGLVTGLLAIVPSMMHAEDCCLPAYLPGEPLCEDMACAVYTRYAGVELDCGCNVFAWGEFLYWRPVQENVWTNIRAENAAFGAPALGSIQRELAPVWDYRPAFSVGIGMHLPCFDNWVLGADYTWYHHDFKKSYSATAPAFLAATTVASTLLVAPLYSSMMNRIELCYDIVGVRIQRPNYLGQRVILSPFLGMKWLHRSQNWKIEGLNSITTLTDRAQATVAYDSIGIAAGMDGSYLMCWNMRLIGKADVGLLYAYKRKFTQRSIFTPPGRPTALIVNLKQSDKHLDILAKGGLGIGWGDYFCCNRYHVDLSATFDFMADIPKLTFNTGLFEGSETLFIGLSIRGVFDF